MTNRPADYFVYAMWLALLIWVTGSLTASASSSNANCFLPTVGRVSVPLYPDRPDSAQFSYAYQYYPPANADLPTVVVVPGGPGIGLIENWDRAEMAAERRYQGIPEGYGLLFSEPRTVDCNRTLGRNRPFPEDALRTEYLAYDLLAAIRKLALENYIIYGHSYGTVLSTVLGHLAEIDGGSAPKAIVLTGVIGRAATDGNGSVFKSLSFEWDKLRRNLSRRTLERLDTSRTPLGRTGDEWGTFIENGLYLGRIFDGMKWDSPFEREISLLSLDERSADRRLRRAVKAAERDDKADDPKWSQILFDVVDCSELTDSEPEQILLLGRLVERPGSDPCRNRPLTRPFDARQWSVRAPLFYFQGMADPATPPWHARHHFESETTSNRSFVSIAGGGHQRLGSYFYDCRVPLWEAISGSGVSLEEALGLCLGLPGLCNEKSNCRVNDVLEYRPADK